MTDNEINERARQIYKLTLVRVVRASDVAAAMREAAAQARLEEATLWHKELHFSSGIPCDGVSIKPWCQRIAELEAAVKESNAKSEALR